MREIKCRAWDEDCEVMYYSDKEHEDCHFGFHEGRVVAWLRETESQTQDEPAYDYGKPVEVEQYTGLKDKGGAEAYHGALVKSKHYEGIGEIIWTGTCWAVKVQGDTLRYSLTFEFTIIGDIHQNPELLEE